MLRAVGQHLPAGVGRGELDEAGRHKIGRDDQRAGVGRHLDVVLHRHRDLHVGGPGLNGVDLADRNTDHPDVVAGVEADRRGEVRDHLVTGPRGPHQVHPGDQHGHQQGGQCDPRPAAALAGSVAVRHGDFGLMISRSEMNPRR